MENSEEGAQGGILPDLEATGDSRPKEMRRHFGYTRLFLVVYLAKSSINESWV